jgi:hypothetical protein
MLNGFKFEPVRWAAAVLAVVTALIGANELVHEVTGAALVPVAWTPYLLGLESVLALLLGGAVRARTTALAAPRDAAGNALVPASMRRPQ